MKLYVMRHGSAFDDAPSGRDADRALTPSGRERVRAVAKALMAEGETPFAILTSPLVRAHETAEIVAETTNLSRLARENDKAQRGGATGEVEIRRELGMGTDKIPLLLELTRAGRKRVMIVGHEPDLGNLVTALVGHCLPAGMTKGMVVGIKIAHDPTSGDGIIRSTFRFVLDPKTLAWQR